MTGGELELAGSVHSDEAEEGDELLEGEGAIESEPEDGGRAHRFARCVIDVVYPSLSFSFFFFFLLCL